jgi:excisionase family DNA binding protein
MPSWGAAGGSIADPVVAAIERHRRAYDAFMTVWNQTPVLALYDRAKVDSDAAVKLQRFRDLETEEEAAFSSLLATRPTTKALAIACIKHVADCGLATDEMRTWLRCSSNLRWCRDDDHLARPSAGEAGNLYTLADLRLRGRRGNHNRSGGPTGAPGLRRSGIGGRSCNRGAARRSRRNFGRMAQMTERLAYRVDEAAKALGVSTKTIKRRIADGTLKSTKIAGVRPIDAESVKALFGPEKPCKQEHR